MSPAPSPTPVYEAPPASRPSAQLSTEYLNKSCELDATTAFKANEVDASARECRKVGSHQFFLALAGLLISRAAEDGGEVLSVKSLTLADATSMATQEVLQDAVPELLDKDRATVLEAPGETSCHVVLGERPLLDTIGDESTVIYGTEGLVVATMEPDGSIMFMGAIESSERETDYRNSVLFRMDKDGIKVFVPIKKMMHTEAIVASPTLKPEERLILEIEYLWGEYPADSDEPKGIGAFPKSMSVKRYPPAEAISIAAKGKSLEVLLRGMSPHHLGIGDGAERIRGTTRSLDYEHIGEDYTFLKEFDIYHLLQLDSDTFAQTQGAVGALRIVQAIESAVGTIGKRKVERSHNRPIIVDRYMVARVGRGMLFEISEGSENFNASVQDALTSDHHDEGFQLSADTARGVLALIRAITPEIWTQTASIFEPGIE